MIHIINAKGSIKFRQLYTCHACGAQEPGMTETIEINTANMHDWQSQVRPNSRAMPVGWTSYYAPKADYFTCPCERTSS